MKQTPVARLFGKKKNILIGMIHLPPLLSIKGFPGMAALTQKALSDLDALEKAGFDAVLIENDDDKPHTEFANAAQIASFTAVAQAVCKKAKIPVGVQMMLNDWKASFSIARSAGAKFSRLDVFVDHVTCDWCEIRPEPKKIMAFKKKIYPELVLLTDIQVKYKKMVTPRSLTASAKIAIANGTDGLIITGAATGQETPTESLAEVRKSFPDFPIFVGAGASSSNIQEQFSIATGAIVGSSIKIGNRIDLAKAKKLVNSLPKK